MYVTCTFLRHSTCLRFRTQVITATIVNSHAEYYINNQRKAYRNRRTDTELQWWALQTHDDPRHRVACDGNYPFDRFRK